MGTIIITKAGTGNSAEVNGTRLVVGKTISVAQARAIATFLTDEADRIEATPPATRKRSHQCWCEGTYTCMACIYKQREAQQEPPQVSPACVHECCKPILINPVARKRPRPCCCFGTYVCVGCSNE